MSIADVRRGALAALCALVTLGGPAAADPSNEELADAIDVLKEEIRRIKERLAIPDTDEELESFSGLGPAASKVYGHTPGLSIGGYGEFYFVAPTGASGADRTADYHRFVTYLGYKFNENLVMNTEIEYEHGTTGKNQAGDAGSVSVEFSYLDFLIRPGLNIRAGNLLIPSGFVNKMHEPPFYRGTQRPNVERSLIPSTWRELGVGIHGQPVENLRYELYVVNGLHAEGFSSSGVRGGRQKGNRAVWEDVAVAVSVDVDAHEFVSVGGSVFAGGAGQGMFGDADVFTTIAEGHAKVRCRGFEARALLAAISIGDADELSTALAMTIPERQLGGYLELAYDLGLPAGQVIRPWVRVESIDAHREVPTGATANPAKETDTVAIGVEYQPHPNVVIKADWTGQSNEADAATADPFTIGAGFIF